MPNNPRKQSLNHLHYLQPKLIYIENSLKQQNNIEQAFYQALAVEKHLNKIIYTFLAELLRKHLALTLNRLLHQFSHCPQTLQTLTHIQSCFPHYKLEQLPKIFYQLKKIEQNSGL